MKLTMTLVGLPTLALLGMTLPAAAACPVKGSPVCTTTAGGFACSTAAVPVSGPEILSVNIWTDVSGDICVEVNKPAYTGGGAPATPAVFSQEALKVTGAPPGVLLTYSGSAIADHVSLEDPTGTYALSAPTGSSGLVPLDARIDTAGGSDQILGSTTTAPSYREELSGGAMADFIDGREGADEIFGGTGADTLNPGLGTYSDRIFGGADADIIACGSGAVEVWGEAGADIITCAANSSPAAAGIARIDGGADADTIEFTGAQTPTVLVVGGAGDDTIRTTSAATFAADLDVQAGDGDDTVEVGARVYGDLLIDLGDWAGITPDYARTWTTDGTITVQSHGDSEVAVGAVALSSFSFTDLGGGANDIDMRSPISGAVSVDLAGGTDTVQSTSGLSFGSTVSVTGSGDNVVSLEADSAGAVSVSLGSGDDDITVGGASGDSVTVAAGDGTNVGLFEGSVYFAFDYVGGSGSDVLDLDFIGTGDASVDLGDGANEVTVLAGADIIKTLAVVGGADVDSVEVLGSVWSLDVDSGASADVVSHSGVIDDDVQLTMGSGDDVVSLAADIGGDLDVSLQDGDDTLDATGITIGGSSIIRGDAGEDIIDGSESDDEIKGGLQLDTIRGHGGADTLFGGPGADRLHGGAGGDTLVGDAHNDTLCGGLGIDQLEGGLGNDALISGRDGGPLSPELEDGGSGTDICSRPGTGHMGSVSQVDCEITYATVSDQNYACSF